MPMRIADYGRLHFGSSGSAKGPGALRRIFPISAAACVGIGLMLAGCSTTDFGLFKAQEPPPPVAAVPDAKPHVATVLPKQRPKPPAANDRDATADPHEHDTPPPAPAKVAAVDPNTLVGLDPPAVEKIIGAPTSVARSDPSLVWTYAGSGCSFQIIFYPDIKTTTFHALKFVGSDASGGHLDSTHACIRNILTARNYGPA